MIIEAPPLVIRCCTQGVLSKRQSGVARSLQLIRLCVFPTLLLPMIQEERLPFGFHQVDAVAPQVIAGFGKGRRDQPQMWQAWRSTKNSSVSLGFTILLYFYFFAE